MLASKYCYIIAEAGVNHNGCIKNAYRLIDSAKQAGADAVKFQSYKTDMLATKNLAKAEYQANNTGDNGSQYDMLKQYELSPDDHVKLYDHCQNVGIDFLSTPFDAFSADLLIDELGLNRVKISSGDLNNLPLLVHIARKQPEVILSTGMGFISDVEKALAAISFGYLWDDQDLQDTEQLFDAYRKVEAKILLTDRVALLHCTSAYPAPFNSVNLQAMDTLKNSFNLITGFSDHTQGVAIPLAAVARGAKVIEKHFTLDKSMPGPDHLASLDCSELATMVTGIRQIEAALGDGCKKPNDCEWGNRPLVRKSIVAQTTITKGERFTEDNVMVKRAGEGISPEYYWRLLGCPAHCDYQEGENITLASLAGE